ncbi:MAG: radical SAM protein [Chloroflexi bacterium]|nr:radical SAM protein [Chloroflexota bacterium]
MELTGLHLLLTYRCNFECDHCFLWGSPWQSGTMTLAQIDEILRQAQEHNSIKSIYFEGGEPFLYYPILLKGIRLAKKLGFETGIVSNGYWATTQEDALEWLRPFAEILDSISVSSDLYHYNEELSQQAQNAQQAAQELGISLGFISIAQPEDNSAESGVGQLPEGMSGIKYQGRAATKLAERVKGQPWRSYTECPYENLREPGRVHIDPFGYMHICQGISIGNLFETSINEICATYNADTQPITGALLKGGPAELAIQNQLSPQQNYADACHLCDWARQELRPQFSQILAPDQIYGDF